MNFIDTIEIKNFKSIRHQKIEGCRRINVFIGYPNVGKSNIVEALSLLSYGKETFTNLKKICRFDSLINIFNDGDSSKDAEIITSGLSYSLKYHSEHLLTFVISDVNKNASEIINRPESLLKLTIDSKGEVRQESSSLRELISLVVKKYIFIDGLSTLKSSAKTLEFPFGENLPLILRHNRNLRKDCGELFSDYNLKLIFEKDDRLLVQKQLDEFTAFQFSFSQVAETLQRLIFNKAAIASNEKTILLFEEPEAHMFPPYISKFTTDVIFDENENQYFLTTHSPYVVNDFMENLKRDELSIYTVGYDKQTGDTLIKRLSDEEMHDIYQYGVDLFLNLENYLPNEQQQ